MLAVVVYLHSIPTITMSKQFTVYLAGGIAHNTYAEATDWRKYAANVLNSYRIQTRDPMMGKLKHRWKDGEANYDYHGMNVYDIFDRDITDILFSNALLVNLTTAKSVGTPFEMGYAYSLTKPLFICAPKELHDHPFVTVPSYFLTDDLDSAINALIQFA